MTRGSSTGLEEGRGRTVLAWSGVAAWGAWSLVRWVGGDRVPGMGVFAAPLLALTPLVAATVPIPVLAALLLRRWKAAAAAVLVAASLVAAVLPRTVGDTQPAAQGPVIKVLTANVYFGEADPAGLVELVRRTGADVLSLQEIPPEAVGRYERAGLMRLLPYKVVDPRRGPAGSGLYARYPLTALPPLPQTDMAMPQAEFTAPGGRRVQITAVHPIPPISGRGYLGWKRDLDVLPGARDGGAAAPVRILAGDFNATLDHATLRRLIDRGYADAADRAGSGLTRTWGQSAPLTIDHVLVDRRGAVRRVQVHELEGSDHRSLFAEVRLP